MKSKIIGLLFVCIVVSVCTGSPYKEFDPYPFLPNSTTCDEISSTTYNLLSLIISRLSETVASKLTLNATEMLSYAEDYGHIIHTLPRGVYIPRTVSEVLEYVEFVYSFNRFSHGLFQIVVRGGSGNVQGAAQASCDHGYLQFILDTTYLNSVSIHSNYALVGPGASWLSLVEAAAAHGLRPTVIPDYLGITVGGFISVGGFGSDSPVYGPAIDQVLELKLVTSAGNIKKAFPGDTYFEVLRGGMGVFGVIVEIKLRLVPTKAFSQSIHILTPYYTPYLDTLKSLITNHIPSRAHTIQSFAIPNNEQTFEIFVAPKSDLDLVRPNVDQVLAVNKTWVYYIELVYRTDDLTTAPTKAEVGGWLSAPLDPALIFFANYATPDWDNRLKLVTVPALVATGAWYAPKPWTIVAFPDTSAPAFDSFLQPLDPFLDLGLGLVAFYPLKTSAFSPHSLLAVPRSTPFFFLATLGRNELTGSKENLNRQERGNRAFWDTFRGLGEASIYASSYITDFGPSDWAHSYGAKWQYFLDAKQSLDDRFIFGDQRNFGFSSLY